MNLTGCFQQGLVYVQEGTALFGNVLGTLSFFLLTGYVKMTNDGYAKYYFSYRYSYMTLNINTIVNAMKGVIFMVWLNRLEEKLSLKAGSTARFLPVCSHPSLKSTLVLI